MWLMRPNRYGVDSIYDDAIGAYSLRKFFGWSNAILRLQRSSDNQNAHVFFDGASSQDIVTTSSFISITSDTVPDTTTLGTWAGSDTTEVVRWYFQTPDDIIDANKRAIGSGVGRPQFQNAGTINTKNGTIALAWDGDNDKLFTTTAFSELADNQDFTVFTVSSVDSTTLNAVFTTSTSNTNFFTLYNDRRTQKRAIIIRNSGDVAADLTAQVDSPDARILTAIHNGTNIISYYNSTLQNTVAHSGKTYTNNIFEIGVYGTTLNNLDGTIQELVLFPSDKTTDIDAIHTDIDTYYSIP